jgi:hypothetical protein
MSDNDRVVSIEGFPSPVQRLYRQLKEQLQKASKGADASFITSSVRSSPDLMVRGFGLCSEHLPFKQDRILFLIERIGQHNKMDLSNQPLYR